MGTTTLRIHHLDFGMDPGDATLVSLWIDEGTSHTLQSLVLVDGGSSASGLTVVRTAMGRYGMLNDQGACPVPVLVFVTDYVPNAIGGVWDIILSGILGNAVTVYDIGQYGTVTKNFQGAAAGTYNWLVSYYGEQLPDGQVSPYGAYKQAIGLGLILNQQQPQKLWPTGGVASNTLETVTGWTTPSQFLASGSQTLQIADDLTIEILIMDGVLTGSLDNTTSNGTIQDRSMALRFTLRGGAGAFVYYHGGWITTSQEGGTPNDPAAVTAPSASACIATNPFTAHVVKLSSKGAVTASAANFLAALNPSVIVVTCGTDGITTLDEKAPFSTPNYPYINLPANIPASATAYLTGETLPSPSLSFTALDANATAGVGRVVIAGSWSPGAAQPVASGDIIVTAPVPDSDDVAFTVRYTAPFDAWFQSGDKKTYSQPIAFTDRYTASA